MRQSGDLSARRDVLRVGAAQVRLHLRRLGRRDPPHERPPRARAPRVSAVPLPVSLARPLRSSQVPRRLDGDRCVVAFHESRVGAEPRAEPADRHSRRGPLERRRVVLEPGAAKSSRQGSVPSRRAHRAHLRRGRRRLRDGGHRRHAQALGRAQVFAARRAAPFRPRDAGVGCITQIRDARRRFHSRRRRLPRRLGRHHKDVRAVLVAPSAGLRGLAGLRVPAVRGLSRRREGRRRRLAFGARLGGTRLRHARGREPLPRHVDGEARPPRAVAAG
mmetsp:Transcript_8044/g.33204  ORF Transcript_8044/g.33204 Transcript_8044/m.33204 type:complete len:275 (-) Transcript_8044:556-1380(-)